MTKSPDRDLPAKDAPRLAPPREIEGIYAPPSLHWVGDGFRVAGYFSAIPDAMKKLDPFLMLDYAPAHEFEPRERPRGVGVHPHRGFETVTIAFQGSVEHHDSTGGGGIIGPGDVQWMTAASGILHKEHHEAGFSRRGGTFQMAQLWVNLPRAHKMGPPRYQPLLASEMGKHDLPNGAGTVRVIAGDFRGAKGPASTFSPIDVYDATLRAKGDLDLTFPATDTLAVLVLSGEVSLGADQRAKENDFVLYAKAGERAVIHAERDARLLVLHGVPIAEPIVSHGPFVMNTRREIADAIADFNAGKFGHLAD